VRSPSTEGNFLFRAPLGFERVDEPTEGYALELTLQRDGAVRARVRLRYGDVAGDELAKPVDELARARESEYRKGGFDTGFEIEGERVRRLVRLSGKEAGDRQVLLVRDGTRLYELLVDRTPACKDDLDGIARGFTILDAKGAPQIRAALPQDVAAKTLEHDYYHIAVLKPAGFTQEEVDANTDKGIWIHLRRRDERQNQCDIKIRVYLARTVSEDVETLARKAGERFGRQYESAKVPSHPKRMRFPASKQAFQLKMLGKLPRTGLVVQEDYRFIEHENGRLYEIQLTTYGGAQREFRADIAAFWRKLAIKRD